jgi:ferredoxin-like protein FixX
MADNVLFLKFKSPHTDNDMITFIACKVCRNKTYTLIEDHMSDFPLMRCAACGTAMGRMGWSHDDEPPEVPSA